MLVLFPVLLLGCKSRPLGPCVSPRVTGRVLAADTHQPLPDVLVTRGGAGERPTAGGSPKGSELLMRRGPARTDREGKFELKSERVLSLIPIRSWASVDLSLERAGYRRLQTNLSLTAFGLTNAPGTGDWVQAGDILLSPIDK